MKMYHWTITSSGFVEAHSLGEAEELLKENAIGYIIDDEKYWEIKVDPQYEDKQEDKEEEEEA
tara:strand:- start:181 stop:369 length:189 start_codon:yes stop_codon:yes gene_type:complete